MLAEEALERFIPLAESPVIDIGSGAGRHAEAMREAGLRVIEIDRRTNGDYMHTWCHAGSAWCSHVLEHQTNPGAFLKKIAYDVKPGGWIAITVPEARTDIVGGHVTHWTDGLLVYNLIVAGLDCSQARVGNYRGQVSVLVQNNRRPDVALGMCRGDIEALAPYFPWDISHGDCYQQGDVRWT